MQRLTLFADVIIPLAVPNVYTYRIPFELNDSAAIGKRVLVQFGKAKIYTGIVYRIHQEAPQAYVAKYIEAVLDENAVVTEKQLKFWDWISFYYMANPGDVMNAALPSGLKLSSTSHIQLNNDFDFEGVDHTHFTEREHQVLDALHIKPNLSFDDLAQVLNIKSVQPIISNLLRKNAIVVFEEIKDKYKPKLVQFIKLDEGLNDEVKLRETISQLEKKAFKQAEALLLLLHLRNNQAADKHGWIRKSELLKRSESSSIMALVKKKIFVEKEFEIGRLLFEKGTGVDKPLSADQLRAYEEIKSEFLKNKPVLLQGVTGSGKTEIYIQLIKDALLEDKEVLFLIPEIALTTQLITRLRAVFGEIVGVYHSRFSENERVEIWNNVLGENNATESKRKYKILLGARSALFLPFSKLGLIIVDEEHDSSFKQHEPSPRYNARDAALYLAKLHEAKVLLGSATPSIESNHNARQKKFGQVKLQSQFVKGGGTTVEVCDLNFYGQSNQMKACLTRPLFEAMQEAMIRKEQVILFQNRRGFAPYTECKQCAHVPHCVQCDVSLIYHKQQDKLSCHYCGYSVSPPKICAACGSHELRLKGLGTEKIEEDIELLFPDAKVARMDLDSTRSKYAYKQLIDDFEGGQIDILIGTQMVTKGLDFGNVSVVGILNADAMLNFPDFRSFEKAFQLITQVRGRAGRGAEKGKVFVQTSQPKHQVIESVLKGSVEQFYAEIMEERRQYNYPPFTRLFELNVLSKDVNEVNHLAAELVHLLKPHFIKNILGPEFPMVAKIKNQYYKRILIKLDKQMSIQASRTVIREAIATLHHNYVKWYFKVQVNVDPQ